MTKKTQIVLGLVALGAVGYYLYTKNKSTATTTKNYTGVVGDRLGFASINNVHATDGDLYNNNKRYGTAWVGDKKSMTGQSTFFSNQPEKLNY
jgi:hypothetical protein